MSHERSPEVQRLIAKGDFAGATRMEAYEARMKEESQRKAFCENCVFWEQSREYEFTGFCKRYAPSRPTPSAQTVAGVHLSELWPVTGRGAWCGEFRAREDGKPA